VWNFSPVNPVVLDAPCSSVSRSLHIPFHILDAIVATVLILIMWSLIAYSLTVSNKTLTAVTVRLLPHSFWPGLRYVRPSCSLSAILRLRSKFTFTIHQASTVLCSEIKWYRRFELSETRGRVQLLLRASVGLTAWRCVNSSKSLWATLNIWTASPER